MKKPTHLLLFVALLALPWATACGVECPLPMVKIDGFCQVPMDGGLDAGEGGTDAGRPDGGDAAVAACAACRSTEFCFEDACREVDFCSGQLGVPCDVLGPQYLKAPAPSNFTLFGQAVAVSGSGEWLAIAAPAYSFTYEYFGTSDPEYRGAVYVFENIGGSWSYRATLTAADGSFFDDFGATMAFSNDGSTLVVSAPREDRSASNSGALYVFRRTETEWTQVKKLKELAPSSQGFFGRTLAISGDGSVIAAGSRTQNFATVFEGTEWNEVGTLDKPVVGLTIPSSIALDATGTTALVAHTSDPGPSDVQGSGSVFIYRGTGSSRTFFGTIRAQDPTQEGRFGVAVGLSDDAARLVVSAGLSTDRGSVYVFDSNGPSWVQTQKLTGSESDAGDAFGGALSLSGDGDTLVVGAPFEDGSGQGLQQVGRDNAAERSGAVHLFRFRENVWQETGVVKASNTDSEDRFGVSVATDFTGTWLAVGALDEDSAGGEPDGNPSDNSASSAGAAYSYRIRSL